MPGVGDPQAFLKLSLARSVRREPADAAGATTIVKRFQSPGPLGFMRDKARAKREFELLQWLHARRVPVPEPLELRRRDGAWEVRMREIPAAVRLESVLAGEHGSTLAIERLASQLGQLLAGLHEAQVFHPDLHAGNALVGGEGKVYGIDFHKARRVSWTAQLLRAQWVCLEATARESLARNWRRRVLAAWRSKVGADLERLYQVALVQPALPSWLQEARNLRRANVHRRRLRFVRESSACRASSQPEFPGWMRRDLDDLDWHWLADEARASRQAQGGPHSRAILRAEAVLGRPCTLAVLSAPESKTLLPAWLTSARTLEHGLAGAVPLAFCTGTPAMAVFELRASPARPFKPAIQPRSLSAQLGALAGSHYQCGVAPDWSQSDCLLDTQDGPMLGPLQGLVYDDGPAAPAAQRWLAACLRWDPRLALGTKLERLEFLHAFLDQTECSAAERDDIRQAFTRG